jgi:ADP-ribose pyrophosphatase YjhB (NUDIX family)
MVEDCVAREYPEHPRVGVGAIVWRGDDVLLIRRGQPPRAGEWSIPGGGLELGETVAEAAIREVLEETGIDITVTDIVTVVDMIEHDADGRVQFHYVLVDVNAEWVRSEPQAATDAVEVRWSSIEELDQLGLWSETRRVIGLAAQRRAERGS